MADTEKLKELAKYIRYCILTSTTQAGSGHPTSALSAVELMSGLFFGGIFKYDADNPDFPNNDRLLFSKGHASPLLYSLWVAAGRISEEELMTYRHFGSRLEGHPTVRFPYVDAATGSLGQGLPIGVGMALNAKYLDKLPYRTYVLIGDSEMAEGSQWEAIQIAAYYKLNNLIGILDVNRLGQRGETMYGRDLDAYRKRLSAFGWETLIVQGHSFPDVLDAYEKAQLISDRPIMVIAETVKGKGVSRIEDRNGWHGKALSNEDLEEALKEIGSINKSIRGNIAKPDNVMPHRPTSGVVEEMQYEMGQSVPTRTAYGNALKRIYPRFQDIVSVDGEVSNSTRAKEFKEAFPERFFEMYIAEQNMAGIALGLSCRGKIPFLSTFSAFMSRAYDQIRMSQYSAPNIKYVGSHAGVSIGEDGPSQMGLEDIAFFRTILNGIVLYPSDAVSAERLVEAAAAHNGMVYIRTTRSGTPVIYENTEKFPIGGCKVLRQSDQDVATVVGAGITVHEALKAYEELKAKGLSIRVIDLYSIKPIDSQALHESAKSSQALITVEDHFAEGGLGEAVRSVFERCPVPIYSLAVRSIPQSGKPAELLDFEGISHKTIVKKVEALQLKNS
jgi:transketolase